MNRSDRRKLGVTEQRYRKLDMQTPSGMRWYADLFRSHHRGILQIFPHQPRTDRVDGKPRRWQLEKARRRTEQIERLTSV